MYLQFSWRNLRIPIQVRNVQIITRINSSQKVLVKSQEIKDDPDIQTKQNETIQPENGNEFKHLSRAIKPPVSTNPIGSDVLIKNVKTLQKVPPTEKWRKMEVDPSKLVHHYLKLSKFRLTSLVMMTSMIGYVMAPYPFDITSFVSCTVGTGLLSGAANSINQFLEVPFDAQMSRTRNRVLVQGHLTPLHAVGFATAAGSLGLLILFSGANALTATLGASNLVLYTMIYTPMKRISILNTWVGSIVGAIPPLMGWAACQGSLDAGALILGGILYAWQFPHFNALSWNLRPDYSKAGYRMMAVTNPGLCRRTALRYTLGVTLCTSLAPIFNVTHWSFGVLSLPINLYFVYLGFKFFKESDSRSSRKLFRFSLAYLPLLMGLMMITKQGLFSSITSAEVKDDEKLGFLKSEESTLRRKVNSTIESKQNSSSCFPTVSLSAPLHAQAVR